MPEMLALRDTDPHQVGAYRLLGRLGEGGQGVVFLAEDPAGSPAAVKLMAPTTDPQVRSRFLKEVAAAQRVARFCTAQVLDAGIFERRPFIVSEYVSGPSLVEVVEQYGPRSGAALERLAVATLTALGAVHAAGMVHRDFKPGNVMLGPDGPVVIDFGLAAVPGMTTALSGDVLIGTPAFMAPEQLAGTRVTAAADMWSWAVTMVFAGTGEQPFKGDSLTATAYAILQAEPRMGSLPEPLASLVYQCLNKSAAGRPSARDALGELVAAGAQLTGPMPPRAPAPFADELTSSPQRAPAVPSQSRQGSGEGLISARPASGPQSVPGSRSARHGSRHRTRWHRRAPVVLAAGLLAAAVGVLVFNFPRSGPSSDQLAGSSHAPVNPAVTAQDHARKQAVNWILQQVNRAAIVSCDTQVCGDLVSAGFPSGNVSALGPDSNDPLGSNLVVVTGPVRAQYGSRLASVYAPAIIASFGSGPAKIVIRLVYPGGAASYGADRQADLQNRKLAGAELLANSQITASDAARAQLLSGNVDPQLPILLALMAARHPVHIVDFVDQSPGGGPASLLRSMDLATADSAAQMTPAASLSWMQTLIRQQQAEYRPASARRVTLPSGQSVLRITYGAPSPLS
jgi:serine/threonine protein kinase